MSNLKQPIKKPRFRSDDEEAKWWESADGRRFLREQFASGAANKAAGSPLVSQLAPKKTVQIALRLPAPDVAKARDIAERKGIGYQTLLKMLVHEGLQREARRK